MRKAKEVHWGWQALIGVLSLMLVLLLGLTMDQFSIVSHAQSQGKVKTACKIRKEANATSEVIGSAKQDAEVTINGQATASDGTVWYQVFVDSETLGFIRSDLIQITDGSTPTTLAAGTTTTTTTTTTTPAANETPVDVTAVNPISATVTGGQSVRVRANASTTSSIAATVQNGLALTVTGQANGTDGNVWYQITTTVNGSEVTGFIRSDFVSLSGELTAPTEEVPDEGTENPEQPGETEQVQETKDWDTMLQGNDWYLIDMTSKDPEQYDQYKIQDIFDTVNNNIALYEQDEKTIKSLKAVIIILVIIIIGLAAAVTMVIFKMRDMADSAYFSEVEKETIRRRSADRPQGSGQKVMHTVGAEKQSAAKPQGARPVQGGQNARAVQGSQRPAQNGQGARPAQNVQGNTRPVQGGQNTRPVQGGQRPVQGGQRPVQNGQGVRAPRNVQGNARPVQDGQGTRTVQSGQGTRTAQGGQRPVQGAQGSRPVQNGQESGRNVSERTQSARAGQTEQTRAAQQKKDSQNSGWKSRNFMTDDDEFEFEFLNWDGEEKQ